MTAPPSKMFRDNFEKYISNQNRSNCMKRGEKWFFMNALKSFVLNTKIDKIHS